MNYRLISRYLGSFAIAIGVLMLPSAICAVCFQEWTELAAIGESMLACLVIGALMMLIGRNAPKQLYQREALSLVAFTWILAAALGALPFVFSGVLPSYIDAYFESMSGFTTTGASVITDIEGTAKSILFWRSFTHWLGGMGIIVLFIAVLPYLGAGGKQLFKSESPGPDPQGLRPRIKDTASILYKIYLGFTVVQTVVLMAAGMNLYDALCHTFGTLATGGFSTRQASVGAYNSVAIDVIIIFFMFCAGANFALYFSILRGNIKNAWKDTEWRVYITIIVISTLAVTVSLMAGQETTAQTEEIEATQIATAAAGKTNEEDYTLRSALHYASFQVVSIMTTTGYCTADFDRWPHFSRMVLFVLMFVGGCAGSTGGGLKVVRIILLFKMAYHRVENTFRPKTVRAVRINNAVIGSDVQNTVYAFFVLYILWFAGGSILMSALGLPFESAVSSVAATLNNIGPGLQAVGATMDYHLIPDLGKVFLSLCMALGRLELFSICVLLLPAFWRHT